MTGMTEPPEGVIAGESVPRENEEEEYWRVLVERVKARLKERGEPYTTMSESELEERAVEVIRRMGGN